MCLESVLSRLVSCWEEVDRPGKVAAQLAVSRKYPAEANTVPGLASDGGPWISSNCKPILRDIERDLQLNTAVPLCLHSQL